MFSAIARNAKRVAGGTGRGLRNVAKSDLMGSVTTAGPMYGPPTPAALRTPAKASRRARRSAARTARADEIIRSTLPGPGPGVARAGSPVKNMAGSRYGPQARRRARIISANAWRADNLGPDDTLGKVAQRGKAVSKYIRDHKAMSATGAGAFLIGANMLTSNRAGSSRPTSQYGYRRGRARGIYRY
jgi:hypothetical protein